MRNTCSLESQVVTNGNDDADSGAFVGPGGRLQLVLFASAGCESPSMLERVRPGPSSFRSPCESPRGSLAKMARSHVVRYRWMSLALHHMCPFFERFGDAQPCLLCTYMIHAVYWWRLSILFKSVVVAANGAWSLCGLALSHYSLDSSLCSVPSLSGSIHGPAPNHLITKVCVLLHHRTEGLACTDVLFRHRIFSFVPTGDHEAGWDGSTVASWQHQWQRPP